MYIEVLSCDRKESRSLQVPASIQLKYANPRTNQTPPNQHRVHNTLGLFRKTSCEVAMVLAGFLLAKIQICQRIMEFRLCQLAYGRNNIFEEACCVDRAHAVSPLDILDAELMRLDRFGDLPQQLLQRVESCIYWTVNPVGISLPPLLSIFLSAFPIERIREHCSSAGPKASLVFTDGSVDGNWSGAAALLFVGSSMVGHPFSMHFEGPHSSM